MIAILDPDNSLDLKKLYNGVSAKLPSYARPIFVRCVQQLDLTGDDAIIAYRVHFSSNLFFLGTYKLKKRTLQAEGFNPTKIKDSLFFLDTKAGEYVPLSLLIYDDIVSGRMRL